MLELARCVADHGDASLSGVDAAVRAAPEEFLARWNCGTGVTVGSRTLSVVISTLCLRPLEPS